MVQNVDLAAAQVEALLEHVRQRDGRCLCGAPQPCQLPTELPVRPNGAALPQRQPGDKLWTFLNTGRIAP